MADASYPEDLLYHPEHDWARIEGDVVRTQKALAVLGKLLLDLAGLAEAPEWMQIEH